jgi:hypothetical protein
MILKKRCPQMLPRVSFWLDEKGWPMVGMLFEGKHVDLWEVFSFRKMNFV